ncbi:hypothetical protein GCM10009422_11100 [Brevundimonas kwangchunensis]|uniref:Phosphatidate cytidylyltransferase n=1 Tax=Brevundimonas kwangchunensis TaxID=322163 RepID=A0ABP3RYM3_9CAUL
MTRKLAIGAGVAALMGLGLWLWSRHGLAVFLDAMIAFCT